MVISDTLYVIDGWVYHCFTDGRIWASLGKAGITRIAYNQGAPKAREKKLPLNAVSGNINHRVPRSNWRIKFWFKMVENVADYNVEKR